MSGFNPLEFIAGHQITHNRPFTLRDANVAARQLEQTVDGVGRAQGAIQGYGGTVDEAHYRRTGRGDSAHVYALQQRERLEAYEDRGQGGQYGGQYNGPAQYGQYGPAPQPQYGSREAYAGTLGVQRTNGGPAHSNSPERDFILAVVDIKQHPNDPRAQAELQSTYVALPHDAQGNAHAQGQVRTGLPGRASVINFGPDTTYTNLNEAVQDVGAALGGRVIDDHQRTGRAQPINYTPGQDAPNRAPASPTAAPGTSTAPATPAAPAAPATTATGQGGDTPPATTTPAAPETHTPTQKEQKELNQQAQVYLEQLGLSTGNRNHTHGAASQPEQMDGIVGPKTKEALHGLGIDPEQPVTAQTVAQLKAKAEEASKGHEAGHAATTPAQPAPATLTHEAGHPAPAIATRVVEDSPERHAFLQAASKEMHLANGLSDQQIIAAAEQSRQGRESITVDGKLDTKELIASANLYQDKPNQPVEIQQTRAALLAKEHIVKQSDGTYAEAAPAAPAQAAAAAHPETQTGQAESRVAANSPTPNAEAQATGAAASTGQARAAGPAPSDLFSSAAPSFSFAIDTSPQAQAQAQAPLQTVALTHEQVQSSHEFTAAPTTPNVRASAAQSRMV